MNKLTISTHNRRLFIARHGETVFNKVGRMQGMTAHTPLTWDGCVQATTMGRALASYISNNGQISEDSALSLVASPSGRTLQTLALITEQTGHDWHSHTVDNRLREIDIGDWEGRFYTDVVEEFGDFVDRENHLFNRVAPGGENYAQIATRMRAWIDDQLFENDMLIITHGMSARVLRGVLCDLEPLEGYDAPIAPTLSQGSMVMICDGKEELIISGDGSEEKA